MPTLKSRESQRFDGWRQRFDGQNFSAGMTGGYEGQANADHGQNTLYTPPVKKSEPTSESQTIARWLRIHHQN